MKKEKIKAIENLLNNRFYLALQRDKQQNNTTTVFLPNNTEYIYYLGMLDALMALGFEYTRSNENGVINHRLYIAKGE